MLDFCTKRPLFCHSFVISPRFRLILRLNFVAIGRKRHKMSVKNEIIDFLRKQKRHLADLQEAQFDRGEKELLKIMNNESVKDTFPAPIPIIAVLVWGFILLFPLLLILHPGNFSAGHVELASIVEYYVPLLMTFFIFWGNQKYMVPKWFFKKKYIKYILGNCLCMMFAVFCREIFLFLAVRGPEDSWQTFVENSALFKGHVSLLAIVVICVSLFVVCLCSILISVFTRQTMRAFVLRERGRALLEYELNFMKQQLSPHFLFNTLNNISSLISIDPKLAEKSMSKLSQLLRVTLYQTEDKFITLKEELDILEKYADLEKLRHDENFEFTFEKNLSDSASLIEPLLLMPLLENAMKHCVNPNGKSFAHVIIRQDGSNLYVRMENSNFPRKSHNDVGGLGLSTFTKRLNLLYKGNFTYETKVENETYICELNMTLK